MSGDFHTRGLFVKFDADRPSIEQETKTWRTDTVLGRLATKHMLEPDITRRRLLATAASAIAIALTATVAIGAQGEDRIAAAPKHAAVGMQPGPLKFVEISVVTPDGKPFTGAYDVHVTSSDGDEIDVAGSDAPTVDASIPAGSDTLTTYVGGLPADPHTAPSTVSAVGVVRDNERLTAVVPLGNRGHSGSNSNTNPVTPGNTNPEYGGAGSVVVSPALLDQ